MKAISIASIILNSIFCIMLLYFLSKLSWEAESERASIVGFGLMVGVYILNIMVIVSLVSR